MKKILLLACLTVFYGLNARAETDMDSLTSQQLDYYCAGVGIMSSVLTESQEEAKNVLINIQTKLRLKHGSSFDKKAFDKYSLLGGEDLAKSLKAKNPGKILTRCSTVIDNINNHIKNNY